MIKRKLIILLQVCLLFAVSVFATDNVIYHDNHVRFTLISEGAIRLEYSPDGKFCNDPSFVAVNRNYDKVEYSKNENSQTVEVKTSKFSLQYKKGDGPFTASNLVIRSSKTLGKQFIWHPGDKQQHNLGGTYRTLDGYDGNRFYAWEYSDKEGRVLPLEDGLLALDGWTVIDDSEGLLFDGDVNNTDPKSPLPWVKERTSEATYQDLYFLAYGTDYRQALTDFTRFAGKVPMPPRYAFGYWWSRYWSYSDGEIRRLVNQFHNYNIPLDVLVIDMDWHWTEPGKGGWTGYTWNTRLFPNPHRFLNYLKQQNLQITLNLHPADGVPAYEDKYKDLAQYMGLNPDSKDTIRWQSSNKRFMTGWIEKILRPLEKDGVDFWWLDWQQGHYDNQITRLSNTWWLNYCIFSDQQRNSSRRPMLYHRWGGLGNHRYQIGFSGDSYSSWASLDYLPYFNSTASNVLYGYWSHDLGGHMLVPGQQTLDTELYARWMQLGTFLPIMRTHSTKTAAMSKEPWNLGSEIMPVVISAIRQRYQLVPYIYTHARECYETGVSLCRPMYYDYPQAEEAYTQRNQYMFGNQMIIAPITQPMENRASSVKVWLPEGNDWYEVSTGTILHGGQMVERRFLIDEYPVYVKAGSIIPTYSDANNLSQHNNDITFYIYPGDNGKGLLYDDNGDNKDYDTAYTKTYVTQTTAQQKQTITIGARKGYYAGMPAHYNYKIRLVCTQPPKEVSINGKKADFVYDYNTLSAIISLPDADPTVENIICIEYPEENIKLSNGIEGMARRVANAMTKMKLRDAGINFIDGLGQMGSISQALEYAPERFEELLKEFYDNYEKLPQLLEKQQMKDKDKEWFLQEILFHT